MANWKISRRATHCDACSKEFEPAEEHYSWLELGGEEWRRIDRCAACFRPADLRVDIPFWRTQRPQGKRERQVDLESLRALLSHVVTLELDKRQRMLAFLIALILIRKRRFVLLGTQRSEQGDFLRLGYPKSEHSLRVAVEPPTQAEMPELRQALQDLFEDPDSVEGLLPAGVLDALAETGGGGVAETADESVARED
ncbi:MAG: hypothetical protein JNM84_26725 [Planctomycetes bacterium]|nr:hypothetical protein [Planctomycetota bacterium]